MSLPVLPGGHGLGAFPVSFQLTRPTPSLGLLKVLPCGITDLATLTRGTARLGTVLNGGTVFAVVVSGGTRGAVLVNAFTSLEPERRGLAT